MAFNLELKRETKEAIVFMLLVLTFYIIIPIIALFILKGITETEFKDKFTIYGIIGGAMIISAIILEVSHKIFPNSPFRYIIHDPGEIGLIAPLYKKSKFLQRILKASNLFTIGFIIFMVLGIFSVTTNTFFIGTPTFEPQQITTGNQFLFSLEPTVTTENLLFNFFLSIMVGFILYLKKKYNLELPIVIIMYIIAMTLFGLGWMALHIARYGGSEISLINVFMFGFFNGFLILLLGSVILFWISHWTTNGFWVLHELGISSDVIIIGTSLIVAIYLIFFIALKIAFRTKQSIPQIT